MKELIDPHQAQTLMLGILLFAPLVGLIWGALAKRAARGLILGLLAGAGNFALWTGYNKITEHLGLDTVKNLLVNLGLFLVIGVMAGIVWGWWSGRMEKQEQP